ncbi:hypothetical protein [Leptospira bandrabouensis]|uniref:hypothetical protein n=1 Tax=Leptospira bandrabouensis TaxID=2484903 RepID=UPI001EE891B8|nr:hypothetical protein [Leptospira bandrabouensis]MCG6146458.1 hypothetical protein [Leptospira bandrabouensis]MCG6161605.1 hypothetical protein [Leptospira bandrabouensis]MCG6166045.1 hypothetical protein [Leptospira bandrabouensis]
MNYDIGYINLKYNLIKCFLFNADKAIVDISYSIKDKNLNIQVVLLDGFNLPQKKINDVKDSLLDFNIIIQQINLAKEKFNERKGEWQPQNYKWLDHLLFSKAEAL